MIRFFVLIFLSCFLFSLSIFSLEPIQEKLPLLLETAPAQSFEILTPVGATKKTVEEARVQLLREAKKVDAEAVFAVICSSGGIKRNGLVWEHEQAYCRGKAIRFLPDSQKK